MRDYRTDLSRARGLGSAKKGTQHFWQQRVTAIANIPLTLFCLGVVVAHIDAPHAKIAAFLAQPWVGVLVLLCALNLVRHMYLGLESVIEDYLHKGKLVALIGNAFFAAAMGVACALAVLKLVIRG